MGRVRSFESMSEDIKKLLEKNLEVSERTLYLVQKMHRAALWARFFGLLKWAIIIGATVWSYLALQPYLEKLFSIGRQFGGLQELLSPGDGADDLLQNPPK